VRVRACVRACVCVKRWRQHKNETEREGGRERESPSRSSPPYLLDSPVLVKHIWRREQLPQSASPLFPLLLVIRQGDDSFEDIAVGLPLPLLRDLRLGLDRDRLARHRDCCCYVLPPSNVKRVKRPVNRKTSRRTLVLRQPRPLSRRSLASDPKANTKSLGARSPQNSVSPVQSFQNPPQGVKFNNQGVLGKRKTRSFP